VGLNLVTLIEFLRFSTFNIRALVAFEIFNIQYKGIGAKQKPKDFIRKHMYENMGEIPIFAN
jgi:hypothetical protein